MAGLLQYILSEIKGADKDAEITKLKAAVKRLTDERDSLKKEIDRLKGQNPK